MFLAEQNTNVYDLSLSLPQNVPKFHYSTHNSSSITLPLIERSTAKHFAVQIDRITI